jgi:hypothetical protein
MRIRNLHGLWEKVNHHRSRPESRQVADFFDAYRFEDSERLLNRMASLVHFLDSHENVRRDRDVDHALETLETPALKVVNFLERADRVFNVAHDHGHEEKDDKMRGVRLETIVNFAACITMEPASTPDMIGAALDEMSASIATLRFCVRA